MLVWLGFRVQYEMKRNEESYFRAMEWAADGAEKGLGQRLADRFYLAPGTRPLD